MDSFKTSERTTAKSTAEILAEGLPLAILTEIELLESDYFRNTTVMGDNLIFNHTICDTMHLNEMVALFEPQYPTHKFDAGFSDKTLGDSNNHLPETNQIIPTRYDCAIPPDAILTEIERLESEHFRNTTVMGDNLIFNHTMCDTIHLNEMVALFEPQYPTHKFDAGFSDKTLGDSNNHLPETKEIIPTRYDCAIQGNSIGLGAQFVAMINQSERQRDIRKNNSDLKSQINLQDAMTLDFQKNDLELDGQVMQQHEIILESRKQLNALTEIHRLNFQESTGEMAEIWKSYEKRIKFDLGSIDESPTNARNSQQRSKLYSCGECNMQFNYKSSLTEHIRIHTDVKPYVCTKCDFASKNACSLKKHERKHSSEKPFVCVDCGFASKHASSLKMHQRKHSSEKPFVCTKCEFACNDPSNLRRHERQHSDEKPFICHICKKAFQRKSFLSSHMDTHSAERSHKCNECQKGFRHRSTLKRHLKTHSRIQLEHKEINECRN